MVKVGHEGFKANDFPPSHTTAVWPLAWWCGTRSVFRAAAGQKDHWLAVGNPNQLPYGRPGQKPPSGGKMQRRTINYALFCRTTLRVTKPTRTTGLVSASGGPDCVFLRVIFYEFSPEQNRAPTESGSVCECVCVCRCAAGFVEKVATLCLVYLSLSTCNSSNVLVVYVCSMPCCCTRVARWLLASCAYCAPIMCSSFRWSVDTTTLARMRATKLRVGVVCSLFY